MRRQVSKPSSAGIITSSKRMSGCSASIFAKRLEPVGGRADDVILAIELDGQQFDIQRIVIDDKMRAGMPASPQFAAFASRCSLTLPEPSHSCHQTSGAAQMLLLKILEKLT